MANSKYEYVREYEDASEPILLKNCYVVVRVDGRGFHKFSKAHKFIKPNDKRALDLMTRSAKFVMNEFFPEITMAYGCSDEYSFIFRKCASIFNRRANKISTLVASAFASAFVFHWPKIFEPNKPLLYPPSFDARCVLYPNKDILIDYMRWRQVDCHINNLYNTTFYALTGEYTRYKLDGDNQILTPLSEFAKDVKALTNQEAEKRLSGSVSSDKNEILFSEYGINYNNEPEQFKKGTLIALAQEHFVDQNNREKYFENTKKTKEERKMSKTTYKERNINFRVLNQDIINEQFWIDNSYLIDS